MKLGITGRPPKAPAGFEAHTLTETRDADGNLRTQSTKYRQESGEYDLPEGMLIDRVSLLSEIGPDGEKTPRLIWEKAKSGDDRTAQAVLSAIEAAKEDIPQAIPVAAPIDVQSLLASTYIVTDFHFGMMAWHEETQAADWDLKLAEDLIVKWFEAAIAAAPASAIAVLAQLGDLMHWDGMAAITPTSGHVLDADTRFQKLVRVVIRAIRRIIGMLLKKHELVHVFMVAGNHDPASAVWLREMLSALYENEPRVIVDKCADNFHCFEHGQTSLFFHHGHKRSISQVSETFAAKYREVFGRTRFSYGHIGHFHHKEVLKAKETSLMEIEQHRILPPPDAHSATSGYVSARAAQVITYHKDFGEVGRLTITPEMVQ